MHGETPEQSQIQSDSQAIPGGGSSVGRGEKQRDQVKSQVKKMMYVGYPNDVFPCAL